MCRKMEAFIEAQRQAHPMFWEWWEEERELREPADLSGVPFMSQELQDALVHVNISTAQSLYNLFVETALDRQFREFCDSQIFTQWMVQVSNGQCSSRRAGLVCYGLWHRYTKGLQPAVY